MKRILLTLCLLASCLSLTACMDSSAPVTPTNSPTTQVTTAPTDIIIEDAPMTTDLLPDTSMTDEPATSAAPEAAGVTSVSDVRRAVERIEEELERLSEVDDAQVLLAGNSAAVALEFDDQYQGGIDDRLREIVQERIDGVISGVTNVVITQERSFMDQLEMLGDRLESATDLTEFQNELNSIINQIEAAVT